MDVSWIVIVQQLNMTKCTPKLQLSCIFPNKFD